MPTKHQEIYIPVGVFALLTATASAAGLWSGLSAMAAAAAILVAQIWHLITVKRLLKQHGNDFAAQLIRAKMWQFSLSIVGLAVSLHLLANHIEPIAWIIAVIVQVLTPPLATAAITYKK